MHSTQYNRIAVISVTREKMLIYELLFFRHVALLSCISRDIFYFHPSSNAQLYGAQTRNIARNVMNERYCADSTETCCKTSSWIEFQNDGR